VRHRPL